MIYINPFKKNYLKAKRFIVNAVKPKKSTVSKSVVVTPTDFGGTRTTVPSFAQDGNVPFGGLTQRLAKDLSLDERKFYTLSISDMMDILIDAHPDMSYALWNFKRIGNSGFNYKVYKVGTRDRDEALEQELKLVFDNLNIPSLERFEKVRSIDKVIDQLVQSVVVRGAAALELIVTENLDDVAVIAPVDPSTLEFKLEQDRYVPYQNQGKLSLDIPTFFYEGLDENIDDPYGRSPLLPAINMCLFQMQVLNDLKAVVHNQGYPKVDIKILEEAITIAMPPHIRGNPELKKKYLDDYLDTIISAYTDLEPDASYVHYDGVEIGKVDLGNAMIDPQKLMSVIDSLLQSGLKTLSTILGRRSTGNTESFAKLEIKLYLQSVLAIQSVVCKVLDRALTLLLNIRGKQGLVETSFEPPELRTDLEREQFLMVKYQNAVFLRNEGFIDQDTASEYCIGKKAFAAAPVAENTGDTKKGTLDTNSKSGGNKDSTV